MRLRLWEYAPGLSEELPTSQSNPWQLSLPTVLHQLAGILNLLEVSTIPMMNKRHHLPASCPNVLTQ